MFLSPPRLGQAGEKPSFRRLVGRRHGVVAFTGFYEWKADAMGERQPYYFFFQDGRPMLVSGRRMKAQGTYRSKTRLSQNTCDLPA